MTWLLALFVTCTVLGIACIGWALINIRTENQSVASSTAPQAPVSGGPVTGVAAQPPSSAVSPRPKKPPAKQDKSHAASKMAFAKNPSKGETLGSLSIAALGQTLPIIEGTRTNDLKKGIGHFTQSVLPGQKDNCVVSGHRDSFFSRLGELKKGDRVVVKTATGTYTYEVRRTRIVGKNDRTVIVPTPRGVLTMTTCYPFRYIGNAPRRYIVSADLVASK